MCVMHEAQVGSIVRLDGRVIHYSSIPANSIGTVIDRHTPSVLTSHASMFSAPDNLFNHLRFFQHRHDIVFVLIDEFVYACMDYMFDSNIIV